MEVRPMVFQKLFPKDGSDGRTGYPYDGPSARSGHRLVCTFSDLYCYGGYNPDFDNQEHEDDEDDDLITATYPLFRELWKYNFASRKWTRLKTNGVMPSELASHSATLVRDNMFVLGGSGIPFGYTASQDLHIYNLRTNAWQKISCCGDMPPRLYGHTVNIIDKYLYRFGGTTGWEYNGQVHRLDLQNHEWSLVATEGNKTPGKRYRHESVCYKHSMYIFGGGQSDCVYGFEKLPVFHLDDFYWRYCHTKGTTNGFPAPRRCHSCVSHKKDVYISGGYNGRDVFDDIWHLNLDLMQWVCLSAKIPKPTYFHAAALTPGGDRMLIFGGLHGINDQRTADFYQIWLKVPSLRELTWEYLSTNYPKLISSNPDELLHQGIPADLVQRI